MFPRNCKGCTGAYKAGHPRARRFVILSLAFVQAFLLPCKSLLSAPIILRDHHSITFFTFVWPDKFLFLLHFFSSSSFNISELQGQTKVTIRTVHSLIFQTKTIITKQRQFSTVQGHFCLH